MAVGDGLKHFDYFNRADEDPVADGWSTNSWFGSNPLKVASNEIAADGSGSACGSEYDTDPPADVQFVAYDVTPPGTSSGTDDTTLFARMGDMSVVATRDGYAANYLTGYCQLKRYDSGSPVNLQQNTITGGSGTSGVIGAGDHLMIYTVGSTISAYIHDGTSWNLAFSGATHNDSTYSAAGTCAIYCFNGASNFTANSVQWDADTPPVYKLSGTADTTTGNTSLTPNYPSLVDADDYALLIIGKQSAHTVGTITDANGSWTSITSGDELAVYGRKCGGAEDSDSITIALSGGTVDDTALAQIVTYSNVHTTDPQDATATTATGSSTSVSTGTLTPDNNNARIVHVVGASIADTTTAPTLSAWSATDPSSLTERVDTGT